MLFAVAEWMQRAMDYADLSQVALASMLEEKTGVRTDKSKVSKMVNGRREVTAAELVAISEITGYPIPTRDGKTAIVTYAAQSGSDISPIPIGAIPDVDIPIAIYGGAVRAIIALSDDISPVWERGTVLFYRDHDRAGIRSEDIGHPCIVRRDSGELTLARVRRGNDPGLFHLIALSSGYDSAWDTKIAWAARIIMAIPPDLAVSRQS